MKMTISIAVAGLFLTVLSTPPAWCAGAPEPIPLWPQGAPGEKGDVGEEKDTSKPNSGLVAGQPVIRLGNVSKPAITFYPAPREKNTGAAVVVCPGGGYSILALDLEGTEVAQWLNSIGVNALLLKYRVPARKDRPRYEAPLQDAQRALSLARQHAQDWGLDPKRLGIMGFSAGAHLSAVTSCNSEKRAYESADAADQLSCRPDFVMLIYPAYLTLQKEGDKIVPELPITSNTPPTFLIQTQDDGVRVESSLFYYLALKSAKVPVEMHLYPSGGHGYGLRPSKHVVTTWPQRAKQWMRGLGLM
ncbi:MAG: alpha/beta hydrolase [Verrucomicrobia bacterium]|nr:alpha/beta hydrolase [Verrucomicrobiota bacterium]